MSLLLIVLLLFHRLREKRNGKKRCNTREKPRQPIRLPRRPNPATTEEALRCRLGNRPRSRDARHPHHHMVALVAIYYFIFRCCRHDSIALGQRACCATREEETRTTTYEKNYLINNKEVTPADSATTCSQTNIDAVVWWRVKRC